MKGPLDQDDGVDGMGAVALKEGAEEEEFFGTVPFIIDNCLSSNVLKGASSNVAFLRFIIDAVGHPLDPDDNLTLASVQASTESNQLNDGHFLRRPPCIGSLTETRERARVDPFALPIQVEADGLLHLYFTTVNLMIPCLHEGSFKDIYKTLRIDGIRSVRRSWLGTLNVVFAITTNVMTATSPNIERTTRASMYFERAMELVKSDILGRPSLEMGIAIFSTSEVQHTLTY
ncbi:Zn(II)2Cys6 transcription factor [Penicillium angulare]|uniref:Zn(II)2Cys6 transcription factor n=1 Tax=Penicillium angulare TaxID=116970 RepID=A0A9W9K6F6_9EURO|nr:Zn(II)2Cys6 transcription factor [Penicillium angulare]